MTKALPRNLCKLISLGGKVLGVADVPLEVGVITYNASSFGRMANGDDDKDRYPFIFAESTVFRFTTLEKYDGKKPKRRLISKNVKSDGTRSNRRSGGQSVQRKRRGQP